MPSRPQLRLVELLASLSLAIDLGTGQPMEWVLKCTLLGVNLAKAIGLNEDEQHDVFYLSLLRHVGCTANAHADAKLFGDELQAAEGLTLDTDDMAQMVGFVLRSVGKTRPAPERFQLLAQMFAAGPGAAKINHTAHCEVAGRMADALNFGPTIQTSLWQIYERWDGKGDPKGLQGENIALPVRVIQLAQEAATFYSLSGVAEAVATARRRSGRYFDPAIVEAFCRCADEVCAGLDADSIWEAVLAAEPGPPAHLSDEGLDTAAQVIADFADLKSPFTLRHSRNVAQLAETAARQCNLPEADAVALRRAGLLHDIGRVGVSAGIWGKAGPLTEGEWERVRLHPYYTERVLSRSKALEPLGALAALHHERLDGSGYHRRLPGAALPLSARLLAAADAYCAMTETRPHRAPLSGEQAAAELRREAKAGRLDSQAADAVLSAAGHAVHSRRDPSVELSQREIEVLRLVAHGLSNKEMAARLFISPKTVGHHIQHIYDKIGVSTRAGATLYAMQNNLLG